MIQKRRFRLLSRYAKDTDDDLATICTHPSTSRLFMQSYREWHVLPRSTHWRKDHFLPKAGTIDEYVFQEQQFRNSFRMTRVSFFRLHALLQPFIQKETTHLRVTIDSEHRLAIFLYHIVHGASYSVLVDQFGVGKGTVSGIIGDVSRALVEQMGARYIRFPNMDEAMRTMEHWKQKTHIPGVVACIDGTHIPIIQPTKSGTAYCNRKGYYSINVQGTTLFER